MKKRTVSTVTEIGKAVVTVAGEVVKSESLRRMIFGTYSDGTPRSVADAISGEVMSPKSKEKMEERIRKSEKKKKKRKKEGKKYAKIDITEDECY